MRGENSWAKTEGEEGEGEGERKSFNAPPHLRLLLSSYTYFPIKGGKRGPRQKKGNPAGKKSVSTQYSGSAG